MAQFDESKSIGSQEQRASWMLVGALALLIGVCLYLVANQRDSIRRYFETSALDIARGLEASISARFGQSIASLNGIAQELSTPPWTAARTARVLHEAARYDPFSSWLGVVDETVGEVVMLDAYGKRAPKALEQALLGRLGQPPRQGVGLPLLLQLTPQDEWLMPVTRRVADGVTAFALVSAKRIVAGTESLNLLPESRVALIGTDGSRLLSYSHGSERLEANGPPIVPERLAAMNVQPSGNLEFVSTLDYGRQTAGYVRSDSLPLFVAVLMPIEALDQLWLRESLGPALVLAISVGGFIVFGIRLRRALRRQQHALERQNYLAEHDMLTGLLNRDAFARRLRLDIDRPDVGQLAVMVIDLGKFKAINDTFGHAVGDMALVELSRRFGSLAEANDNIFVARIGGDEWGIGARGVGDEASVQALADLVNICLDEPLTLSGVELELRVVLGVAVFPADASDGTELVRCADIALRAAKTNMQSLRRYTPAMDHFSAEALALTSDFARALREGALEQVYQPKVRLSDRLLIGVEALARWTHPQLGPINPARFVPLAENSELIHPFTQMMLSLALRQAARWRAAGHALPVSVNVSANNLLDPAFVDMLRGLLAEHGLPPGLLELEVTESALMRHADLALRRLHALRAFGVRLSIDDFGIGYASLSYLKQLPVHTLKLDKAFVLDIERDEGDQRIARASILLAHGFGMNVVAEGIESEAAAVLLRGYGCDLGQGYYFAHPMSAAELETGWLAAALV